MKVNATAVVVDTVQYQSICQRIEAELGPQGTGLLNARIWLTIQSALITIGRHPDETICKSTGDGAIVIFKSVESEDPAERDNSADYAHRFAEELFRNPVHDGFNNRLRFRMGAATGCLAIFESSSQGAEFAGLVVIRASRLESRADPGQLLIDPDTFERLTPEQQEGYESETKIEAKNGEAYHARRRVFDRGADSIAANLNHYYTADPKEEAKARRAGLLYERIAAYILEQPETGSVPFVRVYDPIQDDHFYTTDVQEKLKALADNYADETEVGFVFDTPNKLTVPLFRLYHASHGDHFYTTSDEERDRAIDEFGYEYEFVSCHVFETEVPGAVPLFRLISYCPRDS
jgi:class 3 adenylate cyclase